MPDDEDHDERPAHEAEELMRQRRFLDAAQHYQELTSSFPGDLWVGLGQISALECAGRIEEAVNLLEAASAKHRQSAHLQRFRHLFFVRREDYKAASLSQRALQGGVFEDGPDDQLADLYFNQGRYLEAKAELSRLLAADLGDSGLRASVTARLGACLRQLGELEAARDHLFEALEQEPNSHWTLSELAESERALGERDAARRHYHAALTVEPEDHWTRAHLAQLEAEDGRPDRAVALYEEVLKAQPDANWAKVELAQLIAEKDAVWSRDLCLQVTASDARNPWANAQLAALARKAGRNEEARSFYLVALSTSPDAPWLLHELADTCRHLGRLEEAYATLDRAAAADPYHAATYGYRADFLRGEGRSAEAIAHLGKAVDLDPRYAWAWRELAELKALALDHAGADAAYAKAVELDGDEAVGDGLRAFLLRCRGEREQALPWLERALARQTDYPWAWREQVESLLILDRPERAEAVARQALVHCPGHVALLGMRAEALRRLGRRDEALSVTDEALALDADVPQLWALRAELMAEGRDLDAAAVAAQRAVALPGGEDLRPLLAQILVAAERDVEARSALAPVLAGNDPPPLAWDLAAHLAEKSGDAAGAGALLDRAFAAGHEDEPRLLVRRARLAALSDPARAVELLTRALAQDGLGPWREVAQIAANLGQRVLARTAAYRLADAATSADLGRAWLVLAETELALGDLAAAAAAADRAIAADDDLAPARILAAVLAEQRGDHRTAGRVLADLEQRIASGSAVGDLLPVVLRQLALHHERGDDLVAAAACWERIAGLTGTSPAIRAERAAFLHRQGRTREALAAATGLDLPADAPEAQLLLRDAALAAVRSGDAAAGLAVLAVAELSPDNHALAVQLALAAGQAEAASHHAEVLLRLEPGRRAQLLTVRAALATHQPEAAEATARSLLATDPSDDEAAGLVAEALAAQGRFQEALALAESAALPDHPGTERALVAAAVAGELYGEHAWLGRLGRLGVLDTAVPLARIARAAYPDALMAEGRELVSATDLLCVPPFPRLGRILVRALSRVGRRDLGLGLALAVLAHGRASDPGRGALARTTANLLLRRGRLWDAWIIALGDGWRR